LAGSDQGNFIARHADVFLDPYAALPLAGFVVSLLTDRGCKASRTFRQDGRLRRCGGVCAMDT
jgi:hypothetical protein